MFSASTSRTAPPPEAGADALAGADAGADAEADAGAEPLGAAEPLASTLGIGVADGAGAYVQPGFALVHAATTRTAAIATTGRRLRMGSGYLVGCAQGRDRTRIRCCGANLPRRGGCGPKARPGPRA